MKSQLILLMLLVINLLGCSTLSQGNFTKALVGRNKTITHDAVKRLVSLYPPAHIRFHMKQSDPFGVSLIESLRRKGYSINESSIQAGHDVALYYVFDAPTKVTLYRLTLIVGQQSLSRAYKIKNGAITPLGFWVRKE
jgi:hypothetical protein